MALAIILIEGGLTTRFADVRRVLAPAGMLATLGVAVSMVVTAAGANLLLGMDWQLALLLGAIVSSTDAAAVFSVLRVVPLPRRVAGLLEAESGFNDAPAVILVLMFSATPLELSPVHALAELVYELGVGAAIGLGCGLLGSIALRRIALPASGPLSARELRARHGRVRRGGLRPREWVPRRVSGRGRARQLRPAAPLGHPVLRRRARLARSDRPVRPPRPAGRPQRPRPPNWCPRSSSDWSCFWSRGRCRWRYHLPAFRIPWREQVFLSWAGLRGAVPIVLATFPIVEGVPDAIRLLNIVFILVVVFTLVQGPSLAHARPRLGLIPREATREIQVESAPLDVLEAELLTMTVQSPSRLHNVMVLELRLPDPSVITLIIRDGHTFVPQPDTRIAAGDELLIVTTPKTRAATERRLRAVSRRGKLAYWFDEYGEPD